MKSKTQTFDAGAVKAITFDAGETLLTPWPSVGHVYAQVAAREGLPGLSPELLTRRFIAAWKAHAGFDHSRRAWSEVVDATFQGLAPIPPSRTFFGKLYREFTLPSAWHVFPDVEPTLKKLSRCGLKLGIISNWDRRLRPLLERLELARYFSVIVISREVGATKPDAAIFRRATKRLGVPPGAILHIGDSAAHDLAGARVAGFQALLLRRDRPPTRESVRSLAELPGRLGGSR